MSGYQTILRIRKIEETVNRLGFMLSNSKHGWDHNDPDTIALKPRDEDALPVYTRDAEVFHGTLEQLEVWLRGVEWAREYDRMIQLTNDKKRTAAEDKERTRLRLAKERQEKRKVLAILSDKSEREVNRKFKV
jgi:hypothetical protein